MPGVTGRFLLADPAAYPAAPPPPCPDCGSPDRIPYDTRPPHRHAIPAPCTEACTRRTWLCLRCRTARPLPPA